GGAAGVLEVVDAERRKRWILEAAKVDPDVRKLVAEERPKGDVRRSRQMGATVSRRPGSPGALRQRVRWRAEPEEVEDHRLVVAAPLLAREAPVRVPTEPKQRRIVSGCPAPISAAVEIVRERPDLALRRLRPAIELPREEDACHQQRAVDR